MSLTSTYTPRLHQRILDILLPARCISCAALVAENGTVCSVCWNKLTFITDPVCRMCGLPFDFKIEGEALCGACTARPPKFTRARAALCYDEHTHPLITHFKYHDRLHYKNLLATWMLQAGEALLKQADMLVPVPLHRIRLFQRRYNQSAILAYALQNMWRARSGMTLPVRTDILIRSKHTPPQATLTRIQRRKNVRGAFITSPAKKHMLENKRILLIDDVMTTHATADACAAALRRAGAEEVMVLTLARTRPEENMV